MAYKDSAESDCAQATILSPFSRSPLDRLRAHSKPTNPRNSRLRHWSSYTKDEPKEYPVQDEWLTKRYFIFHRPVLREVDTCLDSFHFPQRCEIIFIDYF